MKNKSTQKTIITIPKNDPLQLGQRENHQAILLLLPLLNPLMPLPLSPFSSQLTQKTQSASSLSKTCPSSSLYLSQVTLCFFLLPSDLLLSKENPSPQISPHKNVSKRTTPLQNLLSPTLLLTNLYAKGTSFQNVPSTCCSLIPFRKQCWFSHDHQGGDTWLVGIVTPGKITCRNKNWSMLKWGSTPRCWNGLVLG